MPGKDKSSDRSGRPPPPRREVAVRDGRDGPPTPCPPAAVEALERALGARAWLLADPRTTAFRVLNGAADGITGLVIDKLGDVLLAQLHEGQLAFSESTAHRVCEHARSRLSARAVYRKVLPKDRAAARLNLDELHHDPTPWIGALVEPEFAVLENGVRYLVRPYDGYAIGLFLEQRDNRLRVRQLARGRRVLNAFAYTCGFSVAAALGGAAATISVDGSRSALEWGRRNFAANDLNIENHTFICSDVFDYYRRARRQGRTFDLILLDPPTFGRTRRPRRVFSIASDLEHLVRGAIELLTPDGYILLSTNHRDTSQRRLEQVVATAAVPRSARLTARPPLPADFRGDPEYAKSVLFQVG